MEELRTRHRKDVKDLQGRMTQKKKQASKKTRKGVNEECDRLELELKQRHLEEISSLDGVGDENTTESTTEQLDHLNLDADLHHDIPPLQPEQGQGKEEENLQQEEQSIVPSQVRKPNRQKARLARRAANQDEVARQAAEEAENLPDMKQQERDRMLAYMKQKGLQEKEIRADGHCLYSAIADQLVECGIPLSSTPITTAGNDYKITRKAAADYINEHAEDFEAFLEEPITNYVHKVKDTAEWGGQLELQALAKSYKIAINVLQDFGRVEKINSDDEAEGRSIWLGYYKHGFGLGEHYNSLRQSK